MERTGLLWRACGLVPVLIGAFCVSHWVQYRIDRSAIREVVAGGGQVMTLWYGPESLRGRLPNWLSGTFERAYLVELPEHASDADLQMLPRLSRMGELRASRSRVTDQGLEALQRCAGLRHLWLNGTRITDEGVQTLEAFEQLEFLSLSSTSIRGTGLCSLTKLHELNQLLLSRTRLGDRDVEHLRGMTGLQELHLDRTLITNDSIESLKTLTGLQVLVITGTGIDELGRTQLARALPECMVVFENTLDSLHGKRPVLRKSWE